MVIYDDGASVRDKKKHAARAVCLDGWKTTTASGGATATGG